MVFLPVHLFISRTCDSQVNISLNNFEYASDKEMQILSTKDTYTNRQIPSDIKFLIHSIISDYGRMDLRNLLDYIYFETEPMMNAETRGEILDFEQVMPESYYKVKDLKLDPREERKLRQEFRKRVAAI
jgi:hypothetical protein